MNNAQFLEFVKSASPNTVIFGDWHGDLLYALESLERVYEKYPEVEILYHVGDFGVWPGGDMYLDAVSHSLEAAGKTMIVTGGNHEEWPRWNLWTRDNQSVYNYNESGLIFLPKVFAWEHAGKEFLSVGGASSIDRAWRTKGKSWWPEEEILADAVERIADMDIPYVDVLITHESSDDPVDPIKTRLADPIVQANWPVYDVQVSETQRELVSAVIKFVEPAMHVHGHWHIPYIRKGDELLTVSLGDNRTSYAENSFYHEW